MEIIINQQIKLSPITFDDKVDLINAINEKGIYDNTLLIPFPYTLSDADDWLKSLTEFEKENDLQVNWAIRNEMGKLIGGIGLHYRNGKDAHRDEIGYWLAKPYWGKGIMTDVVKGFCDFCFQQRNYIRLEAPIFAFNKASARVLEKAGFEKEAYMRNYYLKDGQLIDAIMFVKIRD